MLRKHHDDFGVRGMKTATLESLTLESLTHRFKDVEQKNVPLVIACLLDGLGQFKD